MGALVRFVHSAGVSGYLPVVRLERLPWGKNVGTLRESEKGGHVLKSKYLQARKTETIGNNGKTWLLQENGMVRGQAHMSQVYVPVVEIGKPGAIQKMNQNKQQNNSKEKLPSSGIHEA